jgi:hypothetical protein
VVGDASASPEPASLEPGVGARYAELNNYERWAARTEMLSTARSAIEEAKLTLADDDPLWASLDGIRFALDVHGADGSVFSARSVRIPRPASQDEADAMRDVAELIRERFGALPEARSGFAFLSWADRIANQAKTRYAPKARLAEVGS